jgi:hypothetical protein
MAHVLPAPISLESHRLLQLSWVLLVCGYCRGELAQIGLLLLQAGASVSPRDAAGRQALHAAAEVWALN